VQAVVDAMFESSSKKECGLDVCLALPAGGWHVFCHTEVADDLTEIHGKVINIDWRKSSPESSSESVGVGACSYLGLAR
jgi:hypothetical protein